MKPSSPFNLDAKIIFSKFCELDGVFSSNKIAVSLMIDSVSAPVYPIVFVKKYSAIFFFFL